MELRSLLSRVQPGAYVKLSENIGSAGGFGEGLKLAYEKGHDWIWVMDDDAVPMADALEKLARSPAMLLGSVYALASTELHGDGKIVQWQRNIFDFRKLKETPVDASRYKDEYFEVDTAGWAGLLVSRRLSKTWAPLKRFIHLLR